MSDPFRVFVNEHTVEVERGADVRTAVRVFDAVLADRLVDGSAYVTDGRGIRLAADTPVTAGSILRVVVSARQGHAE